MTLVPKRPEASCAGSLTPQILWIINECMRGRDGGRRGPLLHPLPVFGHRSDVHAYGMKVVCLRFDRGHVQPNTELPAPLIELLFARVCYYIQWNIELKETSSS